MTIEYRTFAAEDLRAEHGDNRTLTGMAAVFNAETVIGGMFREVIRSGAFKKTLREGDPVALWDHDSGKPLGRKSEGTLRISEDKKGLPVEVDAPDTTWGNDAIVSVGRGDVKGMSIGFEIVKQKWNEAQDGAMELREILEAKLFEVSFVTFPAYQTTEAEARSILDTKPKADETTFEPSPETHSQAERVAAMERELEILSLERTTQ